MLTVFMKQWGKSNWRGRPFYTQVRKLRLNWKYKKIYGLWLLSQEGDNLWFVIELKNVTTLAQSCKLYKTSDSSCATSLLFWGERMSEVAPDMRGMCEEATLDKIKTDFLSDRCQCEKMNIRLMKEESILSCKWTIVAWMENWSSTEQ